MKAELSKEECMELLQVSGSTIQYLLKKGELEPVYHRFGKRGRIRNISISSVARYVEKKRKGIRK